MSEEPEEHPHLPSRITDLCVKLQGHPDPEAWRGEIFLESVNRNERSAALLRAYGLPPTTPP